MFQKICLVAMFAYISFGQVQANDLDQAPNSFRYGASTAVPIDIESVSVEYDFDISTKTATATAEMIFSTNEDGYPIFDLVPSVSRAELNGKSVSTSLIKTVRDPNSITRFRVLTKNVNRVVKNTLVLDFKISSSDITFGRDYVRAGFFMSDLDVGGRSFFEQFGPSNLEFDQIAFDFKVKVSGSSKDHVIYSNGVESVTGPNEWSIDFPDYFTTSSLYFHIAEVGRFKETSFTFKGKDKDIPVRVYAESSSLISRGVSTTKKVMKELESDYGAFHHDKLVIYLTPGGGGMEYCGATITSLWALGHELTHSWFARGVMPANGNAGWIDEAIASWRDNNYPRASSLPNRRPVNLGGFAEYRRETTLDAYTAGAKLMSEFDFVFRKNGGMKPLLRQLFSTRAGETIEVKEFQDFLNKESGTNVDVLFEKYVYGKKKKKNKFPFIWDTQSLTNPYAWTSKHPRPFTKEELVKLR